MSQELNIPSNNFKFNRIEQANLRKIYDILNTNDLVVDLDEGKSGILDVEIQDNCVWCIWREIVGVDIDVLKDGTIQRVSHLKIEDAFFCFFKKFAIITGKPHPIQLGGFTITKNTGIELRSAHIAPMRIYELSDHMTSIKHIDYEKIQHPVFSSVKLTGQIETLADVSPFHTFVENIKSIKGIMNTPDGVRALKIAVDGKIYITKKKDENLTEEFFMWLYRLIYAS